MLQFNSFALRLDLTLFIPQLRSYITACWNSFFSSIQTMEKAMTFSVTIKLTVKINVKITVNI